jgi:hypothetical protein
LQFFKCTYSKTFDDRRYNILGAHGIEILKKILRQTFLDPGSVNLDQLRRL